ncbi:MAG: hypothetical protein RMM28_08235, partial [Thermoleophilia bacterium]|nr:hypothetical protein [Gaiellaceae bacterium]MDW8339109.1 hypothetical protein [Thermoleophilia bacterium]
MCDHRGVLLRLGTVLLLVYRTWRRLPASQRRRVARAARREGARLVVRHGPRWVSAFAAWRARRG